MGAAWASLTSSRADAAQVVFALPELWVIIA
jgi:hypothetical protein